PDQEAEITRVDPPLREPAGPGLGAHPAATAVERDQMRAGRDSALQVDLVAHFHEIDGQVTLQHLPVMRVGFGERCLDLPDDRDRRLHGRSPCSQASAAPIRSIVGGCVPNTNVNSSGGSGSARLRSASCCWRPIIPWGSFVSCSEKVSARASTARESWLPGIPITSETMAIANANAGR